MLINLGGVIGGFCARICANGATKHSTRTAQIRRMHDTLTSRSELMHDLWGCRVFYAV
jgi:hypothetical protein